MGSLLIPAGLLLWLLVLLFFRSHRNWLPFYVIGSVGLAFALIAVARQSIPIEVLNLQTFSLEDVLKSITASTVHWIATLVNVETRTFSAVPGSLMVLVVPQGMGWTVLNIGVESSGVLEMAVLAGMVGFYPGWSLKKRIGAIGAGILATYIANVVRITFIAGSLHWGGKDLLFISHTVLGRAMFFVMVVVIFWFILSLPTLRTIYRKIQDEVPR